ncbi:MAG: hypothetical protein DWQ02_01225 [Bacteroidetes bacterium]|nr:MAG: hypothetical protein DWQ02_01225 [Bacteroidota bacterium]
MNYQAVARDADGQIMNNQKISLQITLLGGAADGKDVYTEYHHVVTNGIGLFTLTIGEGNEKTGDFSNVPWSTEEIWMEISMAEGGHADYQLISTTRLLAVPYAFHAATAGNIVTESVSKALFPDPDCSTAPCDCEGALTEVKVYYFGEDGVDIEVFGNSSLTTLITTFSGVNKGDFLTIDGTTTALGTLYSKTYFRVTNSEGESCVAFFRTRCPTNSWPGAIEDNQIVGETFGDFTVFSRTDEASNTECSISDIDQDWHVGGNVVESDKNTMGTRNNESINFITNDIARANFTPDGNLNVYNTVSLNTVGGETFNRGNLTVDGESLFKDRATFDITVTGGQTEQASYPVLIKGSMQGLAIDLTPAADSDFQSHRGNNYISFWRDGEQKGRIEGMSRADLDPTGLVNLFVGMINSPSSELTGAGLTYDPFSVGNPTTLSGLFSFFEGELPFFDAPLPLVNFFDPGSLPSASLSTSGLNFSAGSLPSISNMGSGTLNGILDEGLLPGLSFLSIEDFVGFANPFNDANSYASYTGFIDNFNGENALSPANAIWTTIKSSLENSGMYPADPTNFESQIFSNYTLDIIQQGISTLKAAITFVSSLASIADPEDIFSQGVDLVVEITSITIYGAYADINLGVAYESGAGDYAEWLLRANPEEFISQGDVVGVIGGKVSKEFTHADKFMVVSTSPLLLGNMPENMREEQLSEKIAFMGQVPVKVQGPVKIGDYILPSGTGDGLGIAVSPEDMLAKDYQRIVGVAWENGQPNQFINLINTAVGVNHNDMARQMEQVQVTLNHIQETLVKLDPTYVVHQYDVGEQEYKAAPLAYNVSTTHTNNVSEYFENKQYASREAMLSDIRTTMQEQAGINVDEVPIMKFLFENPDQAATVAAQFETILDDLILVRDGLKEANGE